MSNTNSRELCKSLDNLTKSIKDHTKKTEKFLEKQADKIIDAIKEDSPPKEGTKNAKKKENRTNSG